MISATPAEVENSELNNKIKISVRAKGGDFFGRAKCKSVVKNTGRTFFSESPAFVCFLFLFILCKVKGGGGIVKFAVVEGGGFRSELA